MGQKITVRARPGVATDTRIFDFDRSLTGMGIERYRSADDVVASRPPDVLAGRLFALGATSVTVYSSAIAVQAPAAQWSELEANVVFAIEHLFEYYGDDAGWSPEALGQGASE